MQLDKNLETCKFVFVRIDAVKKPLKPPHEGPYKVIKRTSKHFVINRNGNKETISIDRIKPAFYEATQLKEVSTDDQQPLPSVTEKPMEEDELRLKLSLTRSGRLVKKPKRYIHFAD